MKAGIALPESSCKPRMIYLYTLSCPPECFLPSKYSVGFDIGERPIPPIQHMLNLLERAGEHCSS
jgi:hypothetical protein